MSPTTSRPGGKGEFAWKKADFASLKKNDLTNGTGALGFRIEGGTQQQPPDA